ncbi:MAG: class II aldolase/adducin family protein [Alphaproteobacteria bacterium]|nr:class II aldolase/adducin family protein [Alphaproteobacteria bacterium]
MTAGRGRGAALPPEGEGAPKGRKGDAARTAPVRSKVASVAPSPIRRIAPPSPSGERQDTNEPAVPVRLATAIPLRGKGKAAPKPSEPALRRLLIDTCRRMNALGINQGTSGNASVRLDGERFLITPSGVPYDAMQPAQIPLMTLAGRWYGNRRPSSEWRFHRDILAARPDAGAVIHTHGPMATTLAVLRRDIPAFHYMVAVAGGDSIRCAPYATFGTQALSDLALAALQDRRACLLANHGLIAVGATLEKALALAVEVETLAGMYLRACAIGAPALLSAAQMAEALELFRTYGTPDFPDADLVHAGDRPPRR